MELEKIKESLSIVQHPEFKQDIVSLCMVELQEVNEKVIVGRQTPAQCEQT